MSWIIALTVPSGDKFAFASHHDTFALTPIQDGIVVNGALVWPSKSLAEEYLEEQIENSPDIVDLGYIEILEMTDLH